MSFLSLEDMEFMKIKPPKNLTIPFAAAVILWIPPVLVINTKACFAYLTSNPFLLLLRNTENLRQMLIQRKLNRYRGFPLPFL